MMSVKDCAKCGGKKTLVVVDGSNQKTRCRCAKCGQLVIKTISLIAFNFILFREKKEDTS